MLDFLFPYDDKIFGFLLLLPYVGTIMALINKEWLNKAISFTTFFLALYICAYINITPLTTYPTMNFIGYTTSFNFKIEFEANPLSINMVLLTHFVFLAAQSFLWDKNATSLEPKKVFMFLSFFLQANIATVFLANDWLTFVLAWELTFVPMIFLLAFFCEKEKYKTLLVYSIFMGIGSLGFLTSLGYFLYQTTTQSSNLIFLSFPYLKTLIQNLSKHTQLFLFIVSTVPFLTKLPAASLHFWLPLAHANAPTPISIMLAGAFLKLGGYGILKVILYLYPEQTASFAMFFIILGIVTTFLGTVYAYTTHNLKELIAYSSIAHMGIFLAATFAFQEIALQGAFLSLMAHGLSASLLFMLAGYLQRYTTNPTLAFNLKERLPLSTTHPRLSFCFFVAACAAMSIPGSLNFLADWQMFRGIIPQYPLLGLILLLVAFGITLYTVRMLELLLWQRPKKQVVNIYQDLSVREFLKPAFIATCIVALGILPLPVFSKTYHYIHQTLVAEQELKETAP